MCGHAKLSLQISAIFIAKHQQSLLTSLERWSARKYWDQVDEFR